MPKWEKSGSKISIDSVIRWAKGLRISLFMQFYVKSYTRKIQTLNSIASSQPSTWNIKQGQENRHGQSSEWKRKRPQVVIFFLYCKYKPKETNIFRFFYSEIRFRRDKIEIIYQTVPLILPSDWLECSPSRFDWLKAPSEKY